MRLRRRSSHLATGHSGISQKRKSQRVTLLLAFLDSEPDCDHAACCPCILYNPPTQTLIWTFPSPVLVRLVTSRRDYRLPFSLDGIHRRRSGPAVPRRLHPQWLHMLFPHYAPSCASRSGLKGTRIHSIACSNHYLLSLPAVTYKLIIQRVDEPPVNLAPVHGGHSLVPKNTVSMIDPLTTPAIPLN